MATGAHISQFIDRVDAGGRLVKVLHKFCNTTSVVYGIPRGGIPVAGEIAAELDLPLDVVIARKIPIPSNPEAGYGAVTEDGNIVLNMPLVQQLGFSQQEIQEHAERVQAEIQRRMKVFRRFLDVSPIEGKTAIITDDGLASGFTMLAAIKSIRQRRAGRIVVAAPVASESTCQLLERSVDEVICLLTVRANRFAVASFYEQWYDLTDNDVIEYLEGWERKHSAERGTAQ